MVTVYEKSLKITKTVIKVPTHFVVTVYEKSLKITKAVFKVPTQFVAVTVYEKSLNITKAVIKVRTQFVVVTVYEKSLKITKAVIRSRVIRRSDNTMVIRKRSNEHTTIYNTLHRKLSIEQQKNPIKTCSFTRKKLITKHLTL